MTAILDPRFTQVDEPVAAAPPTPATPAPTPAPLPAETAQETALAAEAAPPAPAPLPAAEPRAPRTRRVLSTGGIRLFGAAMIALYQLAYEVQPDPDGPRPVAPGWADGLAKVASYGVLVVFAGAMIGRRWSLWTGLGIGSILLTLSVACPLEGHHEVAAWWFVQLAVGVAMTALPAILLRRTQSGSRAG
jgi:hypothetical protein